ncbi:hypothetical protein J6590_061660 [Homalodisca vitripennis]|nr:hypothetical protein J6590_061660 [Homalodisca vitripennis]
MLVEFQNIGFLFTGQTVTVAFWRSQEQLYLFYPHPVNENRTHDLENDINNLARLFQCDIFPALASLLLSNAALDGSVNRAVVWRYEDRHSGAGQDREEMNRKKWCCGEGAYNVTRLPPLSAPFYSDRHFLNRSRAYNDLFSFCSLEISGGNRHPSGLSFFNIEGRMYHQVYSLDAPGQRFATKVGDDVQFVNRCSLYIDDGEERRIIAMGNEPSVHVHLEFQVTSRATHGNVLGDRNRGADEPVIESRRLTVWKVKTGRPSTIDLFCPLMEPFQYPLLYPHALWVGKLAFLITTGKSFRSTTTRVVSSCPAWQVEMFARYEEERLRFIKSSQSRSSVQNAMRIGQLNEILDAQRNAPAGRQIGEDITRDEIVQGF